MSAYMIYFGPEIPEPLLATIALLFAIGTALLWVRAYARSRHLGWLLMAGGLVLPAQGHFLNDSYIWLAGGGLLLFSGALALSASLRQAQRGREKE